MALINCPECGKEISDTVKTCPNCGYKLRRINRNNHKMSKSKKKAGCNHDSLLCVAIRINWGLICDTKFK